MAKIEEDLELIVRVAEMYYELGQTQKEIADKLDYSRPMISKILSLANDMGIVNVSIRNPISEAEELEKELENTFKSLKAIVVPSSLEEEITLNRVYKSAAEYLEENIQDNEIIGIGRGSSVYGLVNNLSNHRIRGIQTVPLTGGLGSVDSNYQINETARKAAESFGGICHYIYSPVYLGSNITKEALLSDGELKPAFDLWNKLDWALLGIGAIFQANNAYYKDRVLKAERETGQKVIADFCINLLDPLGNHVCFEDPVIAINLEQLKKAKKIMGIASGTYKVEAILACIKGNWIDILVTDEKTAYDLVKKTKE